MLTGNKGEWSEIYTLLKLVSDQGVYAGDENLEKVEEMFFILLKILRDQTRGQYAYTFDHEQDLVLIRGNQERFRLPIVTFQEQAQLLLTKLQSQTTRTFAIPELEAFLRSFGCASLKSNSSQKADIHLVVHDQRTGMASQLGFSIKSQLGGASTLLNAARTTNFLFRIEQDGKPFTPELANQINQIEGGSKLKQRVQAVEAHGGSLHFARTENPIFGNNLVLIDSCLPAILAEMLKLFFRSSISSVAELVEEIAAQNPLNYDLEQQQPFYAYKVKRFLTDVALGMMPAQVWRGVLQATGGYLVVRDDGELLCYHIYNRNAFEDYLFNQTKLETASSSRHDFGTLYEEDGAWWLKLNLQIRFKK
jgi:hypothetical protein